MSTNKNLYPDRHPQSEIFLVDIFESFRDDIASMEHPIFSLSKKPDFRIPEYSHNGKTIKIKPSSDGLPTIFDKDILLYIASSLINAKNNGESISQYVRFTSYDYLVTTNKSTGGEQYNQMKASLSRLQGCSIETNIKTNDVEITEGFGLIDNYRVLKEGKNGKALAMEVRVNDWFYNSIIGNEVLTIDRGYFRLKKPTDRRLYELARKHCGNQSVWKISLDKLKVKIGTVSPLRAFRYNMKKLIDSNHLPEYNISMYGDVVTFTRKEPPKAPTKTQIDKGAKPGESYDQAKTRMSAKTGIKDMKKALGKR
jgi:plasmid replication initiation protein